MSSKKHYSTPNNLNKEPYLSIWWMQDFKPCAFFLQVSEDENNPVWLKFGDVLEILCRKELDSDPGFIESIQNAMRYKDDISAIAHIKNAISK